MVAHAAQGEDGFMEATELPSHCPDDYWAGSLWRGYAAKVQPHR